MQSSDLKPLRCVREQHPLKQGLRQWLTLQCSYYLHCQRATSIKTRIETMLCSYIQENLSSQRATSIKTRIETDVVCIFGHIVLSQRATSIKTRIETESRNSLRRLICVREQHPLKQGLRHRN